MENPFEVIFQKLNTIENLLRNNQIPVSSNPTPIQTKEFLDINEACKYVNSSKSYMYKLTMSNMVPHMKVGKRLYFKTSELNEWILKHRVKTREEIQQDAINYITRNPRKRL